MRRVEVTDRRTSKDFARFARRVLDEWYPAADRVVFVLDNLSTHAPAAFYEAFEPAEARRLCERVEWHYTPKHGSWLNVAECELAALSSQCLDRRIGSASRLRQVVGAWENERNEREVGVDWRFTTADARIRLRRLYPATRMC